MLDSDEDLQWFGKPHWRRMLLDLPRVAVPILVVLGMVGVFVAFNAALLLEFYGVYGGPVWPAAVGAGIVVLVCVFGGLYAIARRLYAHAEYAVTDERLIRFGGALGRDYSAVDWRTVQDLEVAVDGLDRLFDTGTIQTVTAGSGGLTFRYVSDPYELVSDLETIRTEAHDE